MISLTDRLEKIAAGVEHLSRSRIENEIARARHLAREGQTRDAHDVLDNIKPQHQHDQFEILHLKARLYAQEGRYDMATRYWEHVLKLDPGDSAAIAGLEQIKAFSQSRTYSPPLRLILTVFAGVGLVALYVESRVSQIKEAQSDIKTQMTTVGSNVEQLGSHFRQSLVTIEDQNQSNVDRFMRAVVETKQQVVSINSQLEGFDSRLTALQEIIEQRYALLSEGFRTQVENANRIEDKILKVLESQIKALNWEAARVDALSVQVDDLDETAGTLQDTLSTREETFVEVKERSANLDERIARIMARLEALEAQLFEQNAAAEGARSLLPKME